MLERKPYGLLETVGTRVSDETFEMFLSELKLQPIVLCPAGRFYGNTILFQTKLPRHP